MARGRASEGADDQEVYLTFSPRFERIWLESKKRLPDYMEQKPANIGLRSQYACGRTAGRESTSRGEPKAFRLKSCEKFLAWSRSKMGGKCHSGSALADLGELPPKSIGCRDRGDQ
jgi:hypothetical protein